MLQNNLLTKQSLKDLAKSLAEIAKLLDEPTGLQCIKMDVSKSTDNFNAYNIDISIRLVIIDSENEKDIFDNFISK